MRPRFSTVICLAALVIAGCDTVSGIRKSANLNGEVSVDCIVAELKAMPQGLDVQHNQTQPVTSLSIKGLHKYPPYDQIQYSAGPVGGVIELGSQYGSEPQIILYSYWLNHRPPQELFDQTKTLMEQVYMHLYTNCIGIPAPKDLHEKCIRMPCD